MPQDYRIVVFDAYEKLKLEGKLSSNLIDVTPGKLREECLIVCRERYSPQDHEILRLFFSNGDREIGYLNVLENTPAETFKQASKVINGKVERPGIKYFELLAWLINFKFKTSIAYYKSFYEEQEVDKPVDVENANANSVDGKGEDFNKTSSPLATEKYKAETLTSNPPLETTDKSEDGPTVPLVLVISTNEAKANEVRMDVQNTAEVIKTIADDDNKSTDKTIIDPDKRVWSTQKIIISIAIIIVIGFVTFLFWQNKIDRETITSDEKCMYWTGNQYEAIACDQETINPKTALNIQKLKRLKKITSPDKLTKEDLGKVWYAKRNGQVEFYTDSGTHPLDTGRVLRPLTEYMLYKYTSYK